MKLRMAAALLVIAALGCTGGKTTPPLEKQSALIASAASGIVRVEFRFQYDKGEPPRGSTGIDRCPACGRFHGVSYDELVSQERPLEQTGFLVSPTTVVTRDPVVDSRFLKSVSVRFGGQLLPATISAYAKDQSAVFVQVSAPLKDAKPFDFDAAAPAPYMALSSVLCDGKWTSVLQPFVQGLAAREGAAEFLRAAPDCLVIDGTGRPVSANFNDRVPTGDAWKGSPLSWAALTADEMAKKLDAVRKDCEKSILRVTLNFRSPKKEAAANPYREQESQEVTELDVPAVVTAPNRLVVLAPLRHAITARLERITVHRGDNAPDVPAKFLCSLYDYGGFVASLDNAVGIPAKLSADNDVASIRSKLLLSLDVRILGDNRVNYVAGTRVTAFEMGWRRQVYPDIWASPRDVFLFDLSGALVALPVARRERVEERGDDSRGVMITPASYLRAILADPEKFADAANVPLRTEQEDRAAWLGVEIQPLNQALARMNKVSDLTQDGRIGTIVSCVYPDSPGAAGGLQTGDILLRLHVPTYPRPVDIHIEDTGLGDMVFPWERLDMLREQYFDRIPRPWPGVRNELIDRLTEVGFGKPFDIEICRQGKTMMKSFIVTESPVYYDTAPKFKSKPLGFTVRDLTYEVRRYFQKKPDEPGVIISNIEQGSKASISGLKPYEIVLAVNDKPILNVKDFEDAVKDHEELRLNILRMTKTRIVTISLKGATAPPPPDFRKPPADE